MIKYKKINAKKDKVFDFAVMFINKQCKGA